MSEHELLLTAGDVEKLREGFTVMKDDSDGRSVDVSLFQYPCDGRPRLTLSAADLGLAAAPEGLVCAADDRAYGWTVRVEAAR